MKNATGLSILTARELAATALPPRIDLLTPLLASDTQAVVYGPPGIGKSFFALGIAWAVASGDSFLGWQSPRPRRVLYVDGEMGAVELRDRIALLGPMPERLSILARDRDGGGPPLDLGEEDDIVRLMAAWDDPALLVLDLPSALPELNGDPERRDRLESFLLHQKQSRRAVLTVHHANKEGALHGASRRAGMADLVIALHPPEAAHPCGNARFEVRFEKTRRRAPLVPILAELDTVGGDGRWRWGPPRGGRVERLAAMVNRGLGGDEICDAIGISQSWYFKLKRRAGALGLLTRTGGVS